MRGVGSDTFKLPVKKQTILRIYFCISLLLSSLGFVYYLSTPPDASWATILSLPWAQPVVASILGMSTLVSLVLCTLVLRKKATPRVERALSDRLRESGKLTASLALVLSAFVFGVILLASAAGLGETALHDYFSWLRPFSWWLILQSTATAVVLFLWAEGTPGAKPGPVLLLLLILLAGTVFHIRIQLPASSLSGIEDVYFTYTEGQRLAGGENPYERVLSGNMRENDKYATYLPAFYYLAAVVQALGFEDFGPWLGFWRPVFLFCNLGIAALLYYRFWMSNRLILATFAALFWLFNRWTIQMSRIADIDFIALFLLVLSLFLLSRHRSWSLLLFGLSLAVKQMALFMVPLYIIWYWQSSDTPSLRTAVKAALLIGIIPALASLPFLAWNPEGFMRSIVFSATRKPFPLAGAVSADTAVGWIGLPAKAPLLLLMVAIYWASLQRMLRPFVSALLVMATFVAFNSVFYASYTVWLMPFIPLAAGEAMGPGRGQTIAEPRAEPRDSPRWLLWTTLVLLVGLGLALRWLCIQQISLSIDEYRTIWAARQIALHGLPIFPSGVFSPQGLLFQYVEVPFVLGGLDARVARIPGLLVSLAAIPVAYWVGRRLFSERAGLITAAALVTDPLCIVWGGRAHMVGLVQLLAIVIVYLYYRGLAEDRARYRYLAMGLVVAAVLTQVEAALLLPALGVATVVALPWRQLLRRSVILPFALGAAGPGLYSLISRLGGPGIEAAVQQSQPHLAFSMLLQAGPQALGSVFADLARLPFALLALVGLYFLFRPRFDRLAPLTYLYVILCSIVVPFVLLAGLTPQGDRYLFFLLPMLYLISAEVLCRIVDLNPALRPTRAWQPALLALVVVLYVGLAGAGMAYGEQPDYDLAFRYLRDELQPAEEDRIATQMTAASMLYLGRSDAWTMQQGQEPDVVNHPETGLPVDRWTATPALVGAAPLLDLLDTAPRVWFITDRSSFQLRHAADFILTVLDQMDLVYDRQGVLIFRGEGAVSTPEPRVKRQREIEFGEELALVAFGLSAGNPNPGDELAVSLYWQALEKAGPAHTVSLRLVGPDGVEVAGVEEPVLGALYRADLWPRDTVVVDRHQLMTPPDLSPGRYRLDLGVYVSDASDLLPLPGNDDRLPLASMTVGEVSLPPPTSGADITFDEQIRLLGYDLTCEEDWSRCNLWLHWQALKPVDRDYTVFVHLLGSDGAIITQHDAPPGHPLFPTSTWLLEEEIVDDHPLVLPASTSPGAYPLVVGLYYGPTGERLQAVNGDGLNIGDAVPLTTIDVGQQTP
ncbi:MAG: glycosyltransferase family 39 protein [Anaerolineae bacterium]|nr:glycosyltransferase family 39 protein [Anaerolineae bacterium]